MLWRLQHTLTVGAHPLTLATIEVSTIRGAQTAMQLTITST